MTKIYSGSAVPRHFVFIMADGAFVVQWDENRTQDILTGQYYKLDEDGFGHPISDYELNQLKSAGRVEHFNRTFVWLYALPEPNRFQKPLRTQERTLDRIRAYYLNTSLPGSRLVEVEELLDEMGLVEDYAAQIRGDLVTIAGRNGAPFLHFKESEAIQKQLMAYAPEIFRDSAIAFIEIRPDDPKDNHDIQLPEDNTDLETVIASQMDTTVTRGKQVVVLVTREGERLAIHDLCREMGMVVLPARTGREALQLLEDTYPDMLVMDLELPDMHGWALLSKVKEIGLSHLPIILIAESSSPDHQSFALGVANVDVYLVKPVSKARLRQNIWMALNNHSSG